MKTAGQLATQWMSARGMSDPMDLIYIGVFLDPMDAKRLLRTFGQTHPEVQAHHMTIWHSGSGTEPPESLPWGKTVALKVLGQAEDERAQAVVVDPPTAIRPADGRIPHITLSVAEGFTAKVSNELLQHWEPDQMVKGLITVRGKIGWVDSRERIHYNTPEAMTG